MFYHYYKIQQRFARMKNALIDWTSVARELIQDASRSCIPYVNHPIWTPSCDFAYIRWPATLQQVLLKIVLVALSKKDSMNSQMRSVLVFSWFVFLLLSTSNALSVLSGLADIIYDPSVVQWRSKTAYILVPFQKPWSSCNSHAHSTENFFVMRPRCNNWSHRIELHFCI